MEVNVVLFQFQSIPVIRVQLNSVFNGRVPASCQTVKQLRGYHFRCNHLAVNNSFRRPVVTWVKHFLTVMNDEAFVQADKREFN